MPSGDDSLSETGFGPNSMSYNDMVRYQMVSQYQQNLSNPQSRLTQQNTAMVNQGSRFRYGVSPGQPDTRLYQRQAEMNRMAYSATAVTTAMDMGMYSAGAAALGAMGVGGLMGMVAPMIPAAAGMHFINEGVQNTLMRQRVMQNMASSLEQYRGNIGMPAMTYGQASGLGQNLMAKSFERGQFFNPLQQMDVLKTALANDMVTSKSRGSATGDIKTFEKNFRELLTTTEQIVKTLKTTKEGGLAVIKEMQQSGFGTMNQIRSGLTNASAFGNMTGIGAQNMLQLGSAGARAVQGTSWTAASGAGMFQYGGAIAGQMAQNGSPAARRTIEMAGGVAQAGASLAQNTMNILKSGMGAKVMAYMMNDTGELNQGRLNAVMSGRVSGYAAVMGGADRAYHMTMAGNRPMFDRWRSERLNEMAESDPVTLEMIKRKTFSMWAKTRRGTLESKAQVWGKMWSAPGDERSANLIADGLMNPVNFGQMRSEQVAARAIASDVGPGESQLARRMRKIKWENFGGLIDLGTSATLATGDLISGFEGAANALKFRSKRSILKGLERVIGDAYGLENGNIGNAETGMRKFYGATNKRLTQEGAEQYVKWKSPLKKSLFVGPAESMDLKQKYGIDVEQSIANSSAEDIAIMLRTAKIGLGNENPLNALNNAKVLRVLGVKKGSEQYRNIMRDSAALSNIITGYTSGANKVLTAAEAQGAQFDKYVSDHKDREVQIRNATGQYAWMSEQEKLSILSNVPKNADGTIDISKVPKGNQDLVMVAMKAKSDQGRAKTGTIDYANMPTSFTRDSQIRKNAMTNAQLISGATDFQARNRAVGGVDREEKISMFVNGKSARKLLARLGVVSTDPTTYLEEYQRVLQDSSKGGGAEQLYNAGLISGKNVKDAALAKLDIVSKSIQQTRGLLDRSGAVAVASNLVNKAKNLGVTSGNALNFIQNFEGTLSSTDVKQMADAEGFLSVADLSQIKGFEGGKKDLSNEVKKQVYGLMINNVAKNSPEDGRRLQMDVLNKELQRIQQTVNLSKDWKTGEVIYYDEQGKKRFASNRSAAEQTLRAEIESMKQMDTKLDPRSAAQGNSVDTTTHPPVLNYWSNRWTFG